MTTVHLFQRGLPALRDRPRRDDRRRAQGLPPVHHRLLVAAARGPRQPAAAADDRAEGGRQRLQLPVGEHLRALPEAARLLDGGDPTGATARRHDGEGLPPQLGSAV